MKQSLLICWIGDHPRLTCEPIEALHMFKFFCFYQRFVTL